jgi:hypothetical protein
MNGSFDSLFVLNDISDARLRISISIKQTLSIGYWNMYINHRSSIIKVNSSR